MANKVFLTSPFPVKRKRDGQPQDGLIYQLPKYCSDNFSKLKCQDFYDSLKSTGALQFAICPKGFLVAHFQMDKEQYAVSGMIDFNDKSKLNSDLRARYRNNSINSNDIKKWHENIRRLDHAEQSRFQDKMKRSLQPYHDIKRLIGSITSNAEKLAKKANPILALREAIENAPEELKAIHKTTELMDLLGTMIDALANPDLLSSGRQKTRSVYGSFHKIKKILSATAEKKKVNIKVTGSDRRDIQMYDCFELLPLTILDNAIKYSHERQDVIIDFRTDGDNLTIEISNTGVPIFEDEKISIFELFKRGRAAKDFVSEGAGIGLYMAQKVSELHKAKIDIKCDKSNSLLNNLPISVTTVTISF
jgi:K+-sensing histidine kinase KdpD